MKWKTAALAALLTIAASTGAMAYDMNTLAEKTLPKSFKYMAIPGEQTMEFNGAEVPYKMGQLQITLKRSQKFYSGYIIRTTLPPEVADAMHPYFRLNPTVTEWRGLAQLNRALMNPSSQLRKGIDKTLLNLAVNALGQVAKEDVKVEISDIEPFRRLDAGEAYVYTAGGRIVYDAQGLLMPMYARSYFFLGENGLEVMMLLAPDEGKDILVYAMIWPRQPLRKIFLAQAATRISVSSSAVRKWVLKRISKQGKVKLTNRRNRSRSHRKHNKKDGGRIGFRLF